LTNKSTVQQFGVQYYMCNTAARKMYSTKVYYRIHKRPPPAPTHSQFNSLHASPSYFLRSISILSSHLRRSLPSGLFPSGLHTKTLYATLHSPHPATCHAIPITANLPPSTNNEIGFVEENQIWKKRRRNRNDN